LNSLTMKKGRIIILSGPSGSGKTTLYQKLLSSKEFKGRILRSLSVTTRPRRHGEKNGRDYLFLSEKNFLAKRRKGDFLEWQKVFLYYYATQRENVRDALQRGKNVLLSIDVKGAKVVAKKCPAALKIFIKAPSLKALRARLRKRATETAEDLKIRLRTAAEELREAKKYDYVLVNDDLGKCYKKLAKILFRELGLGREGMG
jgi:guanylate kinase